MGIPFVKDWFPPAFTWLYNLGWQVRYKVIEARDRFDDVGDFLERVEWGDLFEDFLDGIWGAWKQLRDDPWGFVKNQAFKIDPTIYYWLNDPVQELRLGVIKLVPNGRTLLDNPKQWVFDRIVDFWPDFYWLWSDPVYTIKGYVAGGSPSVMLFLDNPKQWAKEQIADLLSVPMDFYDDPWGWVLYMVKVKLDERSEYYTSWLYDFGEHLLRFFVEGEW